jgi:hypothetical protein
VWQALGTISDIDTLLRLLHLLRANPWYPPVAAMESEVSKYRFSMFSTTITTKFGAGTVDQVKNILLSQSASPSPVSPLADAV